MSERKMGPVASVVRELRPVECKKKGDFRVFLSFLRPHQPYRKVINLKE